MDNEIRTSLFLPGYVLEERLLESPPHVIYTAKTEQEGLPVVVKTLLDKYPLREDLSSLKREYRIASKLDFEGIVNIYDLLDTENGNLAMVMQRFGISLFEFSQSFANRIIPVNQFLPILIKIVRILGKIHDSKVIHKDIVPRNILIDPVTHDIRIIDFSNSSELSREFQSNLISDKIQGSLAYMSPEQTGRINRDIDYRTDYYSLGIVCYELLGGQLPFHGEDALEWIHSHISKQPKPLNTVNPKIPKVLSNMVMKLMAKNAEDRYQSSFGIIADLEKCQEEIQKGLFDFDFELGQQDVSPEFQIPQKLYGREKELETLHSYFEKVLLGSVEFCLVSGYSGVGKSVLVQELGRSIAQEKGYLIQGKFEQFRQNAAYMALASAFRDLIKQILGEPAKRLNAWREELLLALGSNGQLMIDLVPELELVIGKQQTLPELPPEEAQNRFLIVFTGFLKVFAKANHPIVIFLDDLQWSDIPTLNLINRLVTSQDLSYLLLLGAYRDHNVDNTHPLLLTLGEIEKQRYVEDIKLKPLKNEAVANIIKDTLLCRQARANKLSNLLFEKTEGNPFFTIELLKNLNERGIIYFNSDNGTWDWDSEKIKNTAHSDNVIDFLVSGLELLPRSTQQVLELAACIGASFDLKNLSIIQEQSMEATASELYRALKSNMIIPLNESYKFFGIDPSLNGSETNSDNDENTINPIYRFQHDRVQQAAYSMIPDERRHAVHLSIGRLMLKHQNEKEINEGLMEIVGHLNEGRFLLTDADEKTRLAGLNLEAGIKAKTSSAYEAALDYLKIGYELVHENGWAENFDLCWKLSEEIQHCFYLTGDWENADKWTDMMLKNARTDLQKGSVLSAKSLLLRPMKVFPSLVLNL